MSQVDLDQRFSSHHSSSSKDVVVDDLEKRKLAAKAANSVVSLVQQVGHGVPPNNRQIIGFIDRTNDGLSKAAVNAKLNKRGKKLIKDSVDFMEASKRLLHERNNDELLQSLVMDSASASVSVMDKSPAPSLSRVNSHFKSSMIVKTGKTGYHVVNLILTSSIFRNMMIDLFDAADQALTPAMRFQDNSETDASTAPSDAIIAPHHDSVFRPLIDSMRENRPVSIVFRTTAKRLFDALILFLRGDTSNVNPETKKQLNERFQAFLLEISENTHYRRCIHEIIVLFDSIKQDVLQSTKLVNDWKQNTQTDQASLKVVREAKDFVERFAGRQNVKKLLLSIDQLIKVIQQDEELIQFLPKVSRLLEQILNSPELLSDPTFLKETHSLVGDARKVYSRYHDDEHWNNFINRFKITLNQIEHDEVLSQWRHSLTRLSQNVVYTDNYGKMHLDKAIFQQIRAILIPVISEQLSYIAIPTLSGSNKKIDWTVSQIVFSGYDLLPEHVKIKAEIGWKLDVKRPVIESSLKLAFPERPVANLSQLEAPKPTRRRASNSHIIKLPVNAASIDDFSSGKLFVRFENINADIQDIAFIFRRKVFPRITDQGLATVSLGGKGVSLTVTLDVNTQNPDQLLFTGGTVCVEIDNIRFKITKSHHDLIYKVVTSCFDRIITKQIEAEISLRVSNLIADLTMKLNSAYSRLPREGIKNSFLSGLNSIMS